MRRSQLAIVIIGALAIIGGGAVVFARREQPQASVPAAPAPVVAAVSPAVRSWMNGSVLAPDAVQPAAAAVVIDNAPEARPQSGIADAPLVFSVPVEGARTRFLAVLPYDAHVVEVGPVRSARPYLVALAEILESPLVHVGGSPEALAMLSGRNHIDQYYDVPFRRVTFRHAPFNVYTAMRDLAEFLATRSAEGAPVRRHALWSFAESVPEETGNAIATVRVGGEDAVEWVYDAATKMYGRAQAGRAHRDADGKPVRAANVVLLRVNTRVLDAVGRLEMTFPSDVAPQEAVVYSGGTRTSGLWAVRKNSAGVRLSDTAGNDLTLAPGTTWVEVLNRELPST